MGLLFSYFRRPKDAVAELESIESRLSRLESRRQSQLNLQKRLLGYLLIGFLLGYPIALAVYYAYCMPVSSWLARAAHVAAFVAALPLFYGLRRCLLWLFMRSLASCEASMRRLRDDKQLVLDRVMDTETYKRAKDILDRFDPDRFKAEFQQQQQQQQTVKPGPFFSKSPLSKRPPPSTQPPQPGTRTTPPHHPQQHQHHQPQHQQLPPPPGGGGSGSGGVVLRQLSAVPSPPPPHQLQQPPAQLPRPVLSRERSIMDRVIDMLVGDGADRRYALICRRCCGHNGMAMAEEFPYLAWRCAYCANLHTPRQQRPAAPPLEPATATPVDQSRLPVKQPQPQPQQQNLQRPQWQSLVDLRPQSSSSASADVGGIGTQSLRSSSGSSTESESESESLPATLPLPLVDGAINGIAGKVATAAEAETGTAQLRSRFVSEPSE